MSAQASESLLEVEKLCKYFPIYSSGLRKRVTGWVKACDEISFTLHKGETLGVVGESGSGKSTLARTILRATTPTSGRIVFHGSRTVDLAALSERQLVPLRSEMQMIFQDPFTSLNPRFTIAQSIAEPLLVQGLASGSECEDRVVAIMKRVGLRPEYRSRYPHAFSGGQRQRIGIARALVSNPQLVVADEAVSALDVSVQAQIINLLRELQEERGLTYLFIAHDLSIVRHIANTVAVMTAGKVVELGSTEQVFSEPKHSYTRRLLGSVLDPDPDHLMLPNVG